MFDLGDDNVDYMLNEMTSAQRRIVLAYIQRLQKKIVELETERDEYRMKWLDLRQFG